MIVKSKLLNKKQRRCVSIIIPTYNEAENIKKIIPKLFRIFSENELKGEVVVVDDNSLDGTANVVKILKKNSILN